MINAMTAGDTTVVGLDTDDTDDDLDGDAGLVADALQHVRMLAPEVCTQFNALPRHELGPVFAPGQRLLGRSRNQLENPVGYFRFGQVVLERRAVVIVLGDHLVDERDDIWPACIERESSEREGEEQCSSKVSKSHQRGSNFRLDWIDIRIPKPASSVTIDVPPKLTNGKGIPTTGTSPVTIAVLTKT